MKKCLTCKKDITALNYFTRVDYCTKKCEKKGFGDNDFIRGFNDIIRQTS
jgi:hypothetical protein